ncbi:type II toxin-antitoxin system Phd/YefM family antitoxin [Laspinema olomoucense]|uniref:type II toxin-antitoxin system Phd/YefM family antitoxin n=1 Tax=Laspinema olomoucense TaxID=3231600 RepID=UPI0021BA5A07|nr:prevent-host-death protein [Laspinema sp. D3c]MCT7996116.1 prevent-host-death protein [Laspinema sp. D3c]
MNKVTVEEVNQNLMNYLQRAQAGESFVIFQADQPIAKISSAKSEGAIEVFDAFRSRILSEEIDLDSDEIFADVRARTPTPEQPCW